MSDTLITIVAVVLSAFLMFVFPVITMAERVEAISQTDIETITSQFVDEIKNTGKLRIDQYNEFKEKLTSNRKFI